MSQALLFFDRSNASLVSSTLTERVNLQFRSEFFNAFNDPYLCKLDSNPLYQIVWRSTSFTAARLRIVRDRGHRQRVCNFKIYCPGIDHPLRFWALSGHLKRGRRTPSRVISARGAEQRRSSIRPMPRQRTPFIAALKRRATITDALPKGLCRKI